MMKLWCNCCQKTVSIPNDNQHTFKQTFRDDWCAQNVFVCILSNYFDVDVLKNTFFFNTRNLFMELFLLWLLWIASYVWHYNCDKCIVILFVLLYEIYLVMIIFVGAQALNLNLQLWTAMASIISQSGNLFICIYCPWLVLRKLKQPKTKIQQKQTKHSNLVKILSKKAHFFAFVEHLVHELSIEVQSNLSFISTLIRILFFFVSMYCRI